MRKRKDLDLDLENNNDDLGDIYEEEDLVIYKTPDGKIKSCGFDVNSVLLREGKKPMYTINNEPMFAIDDSTQKVSDLFKDMAIPAGLFYLDSSLRDNSTGTAKENAFYKNDQEEYNDEEEIDEDIYEKLLNLVTILEKRQAKKNTRKRMHSGKKTTRITRKNMASTQRKI